MAHAVETPAVIEDLRETLVELVAEPEMPKADLDKPLGQFDMTYYWIAKEPKKGKRTQKLVDRKCKKIAKVTKGFKKRLTLEGTGKLQDGRLVTTAGGCKCGGPCFWVATKKFQWGAGVAQRPLSPFRSIAVDPKLVSIGQTIYVAELDGLTMPGAAPVGGFVHDGCVVADDRGGGVRGKQIDFFAAKRSHYRSFFKRHKINTVSVYEGGDRCSSLLGNKEPRVAASNNSI